jgi:ArsR family transcriptional regulator
VNDAWDTLRLLAEPTRLRLLALLAREELAVMDLQEILGMGQSRVSTQLALLRQAGFVADRRNGKRAFYSLRDDLPAATRELLATTCRLLAADPALAADSRALDTILQRRRDARTRHFNELAGLLGKKHSPGRSWEAIGHLLLRMTPPVVIADLGAGEGMIAHLLAPRAAKVYCVDNSPRMVAVGSKIARENGTANVHYRLGDIERVPLADTSVDIAILSQALHHARRPERAVGEAFRILRHGGRLFVLDLKAHSFEKARRLYSDHWLGFTEDALHAFLRGAGFVKIEVSTVAREDKPPFFETLLAAGLKPPRTGGSAPLPLPSAATIKAALRP